MRPPVSLSLCSHPQEKYSSNVRRLTTPWGPRSDRPPRCTYCSFSQQQPRDITITLPDNNGMIGSSGATSPSLYSICGLNRDAIVAESPANNHGRPSTLCRSVLHCSPELVLGQIRLFSAAFYCLPPFGRPLHFCPPLNSAPPPLPFPLCS